MIYYFFKYNYTFRLIYRNVLIKLNQKITIDLKKNSKQKENVVARMSVGFRGLRSVRNAAFLL